MKKVLSVLGLTTCLVLVSFSPVQAEEEEVIEIDLDEMVELFENGAEQVEDEITKTLDTLAERFEKIIETLDEAAEEDEELDPELVVEMADIIDFLDRIRKSIEKLNIDLE